MRITVTGFDAFGGLPSNSSEVGVLQLAREGSGWAPGVLDTLVLPTVYSLADQSVRILLHSDAPDLLLMTGMASSSQAVLIETRARNLDACPEPDNAGEVRLGNQVRRNGPEFYSANINVPALYRGLRTRAIQALISDDAGGFVCNHAFYVACHEIDRARLPTRCGFLHLPGMDEDAPDGLATACGWTASTIAQALRASINVLCPADDSPPQISQDNGLRTCN
jgi:pyroglutamyl-peptidase